ncbi:hypothetical protein AV530_017446 [Patagioenas fasciata monilis]|uniref:Uncharacterized protein n=1 Tax=Patagioenas fasciata monilis TaxID=372326 RepID=A0A1V4JG76_PATFA|nr:hypothetical protein AV530_017446 [Patagioenas fasciata monilis]
MPEECLSASPTLRAGPLSRTWTATVRQQFFPQKGVFRFLKKALKGIQKRQSHACATIFSPGKNIWNVNEVSAELCKCISVGEETGMEKVEQDDKEAVMISSAIN